MPFDPKTPSGVSIRPANWPEWVRDPLPVDWPEDGADEDNGCYQHNCSNCRVLFFGHKRRLTCKACDTAQLARWNALTPAQQLEETSQNLKAIERWVAEHKP